MLNLTKGESSENIVVTLDEKKTLAAPYYLFVFENILTRDEVKFIKGQADDLSDYPTRYNEYTIDTSDLFDEYLDGEWNYRVYEQESDSNLDPAEATGEVERGKMNLNKATPSSYITYNEPVSNKAYNG
jgi:hypothetical protein